MKKKFIKVKGGTGGTSYSIIVPRVFLELIGCNLDNMDLTMVDVSYSRETNQITIGNPQIIEKT